MEKNFDKSVDLKLKGISNDKVSDVYYSTKPESSSPNGKPASEEEDDGIGTTYTSTFKSACIGLESI